MLAQVKFLGVLAFVRGSPKHTVLHGRSAGNRCPTRPTRVAGGAGKGCCKVKGWNGCFLTKHVGTYCRYLASFSKEGLRVWFWKISLHIPFTMFHIHFSLWGAWNRYSTSTTPLLNALIIPGIQSQHTRVAGDLGSARENWVQVFVDPSCQNTYCTFTLIL